MNKRTIQNSQVPIFKDGEYSLFDEKIKAEKPTPNAPDDESAPELTSTVNAESVLGSNQLAADYEGVIAARTAGLAADIGALSTGVMGAAPAAAGLDMMSLLLNLYADLNDQNTTAGRTAENLGINSLTVAANLAPVVGQGLAKASRATKFAKQAIEIGQYLLAVYGIAMAPAQYKRAKYAVDQLTQMADGTIEPTMYDVTRHVKDLVMLFAVITGVVRARESSYKTAADELAGSKSVDASYVGQKMQNNPIWNGYQAARNAVTSPVRSAGESIRKYVFGEGDVDRLRARYADERSVKGLAARQLFGGAKPGAIGRILGQDTVPQAPEMRQTAIDMHRKNMPETVQYLQDPYLVKRPELDYLKDVISARKPVQSAMSKASGDVEINQLKSLDRELNKRIKGVVAGKTITSFGKAPGNRDQYMEAMKRVYSPPNKDKFFENYQNLLNKINI